MSGAAEHPFYVGKGCVASINVGLPGKAVKGRNWNKHRRVLLDIFVTALTFSSDTIATLCLRHAHSSHFWENDALVLMQSTASSSSSQPSAPLIYLGTQQHMLGTLVATYILLWLLSGSHTQFCFLWWLHSFALHDMYVI